MRIIRNVALSVAAATAAGLTLASWSAAASAPVLIGRAVAAAPTLSSADAAGLTFSREEERMAHDLYTLFATKYTTSPFARIATSEQRHFDAVHVLLTRYSVSDPSAGAKAGVYADKTLQGLYDQWKASGMTSAAAAYRVGIALEKRDIADLQRLQAATSNTDLDRLYTNLEAASKHHLAMFTAAASGQPMPAGNGPAARRSGQDPGMMGQGQGQGYRGGPGRQNRSGCMTS